MEVNKWHRNIGLISVFSFLIGLYIFGYAIAAADTKFINIENDNKKNYTISFSLANGSKVGMTVFFTFGTLFLLLLLYYKFNIKDKTYFLTTFLVIASYSLLISMVYYSFLENQGETTDDETQHYAVAIATFVLVLIFNIITAYIILYKSYRKISILLIVAEIAFFFSLAADIEYQTQIKKKKHENRAYKDIYFPIGENINYLFFITSILLLSLMPLNRKNPKLFRSAY